MVLLKSAALMNTFRFGRLSKLTGYNRQAFCPGGERRHQIAKDCLWVGMRQAAAHMGTVLYRPVAGS